MQKRNKIASVVLFLAALVVGLDAQPGWGSFGFLKTGYTQCDVANNFPSPAVTGMVVLQDGTVLVADTTAGIYSFKPGSVCAAATKTRLSTHRYSGMAIGNDGQIYANGNDSTGNLYIISPISGGPTSTVLTGIWGLGMALDPLTGDLYVTQCGGGAGCPGSNIRRITGLYGPHPNPTIHPFVNVAGSYMDGLAWSCDGTRLVAASQDDRIFQFNRHGDSFPNFPLPVPSGTIPDGIAFGRDGTALGAYFFVNNEGSHDYPGTGSVSKIANDGSTYEIIADQGMQGDFIAVDTQGNLLLTQSTIVTRLSSDSGQWVMPGSSLCGDLGCGAKAATIKQIGQDSPCLSGLDANLVLTLSQSACVDCAGCATLNQARATLLDLLNSLDPPRTCLDGIKLTLEKLYLACPCNCPCVPSCLRDISRLSVGPCMAQTKFPFGIDLEFYDPILETFMRKGSSP